MTEYELSKRVSEVVVLIHLHDKGLRIADNIDELKAEGKRLAKQLADGEYDKEINARGNEIKRGFIFMGSRYQFDDSLKLADGWEQYDTSQDAPYFGVWANKKLKEIRTFAEGDVITVICPTVENYNAEIEDMNRFYEEGCIAVSISKEDKATVYRQNREKFFIKEEELV